MFHHRDLARSGSRSVPFRSGPMRSWMTPPTSGSNPQPQLSIMRNNWYSGTLLPQLFLAFLKSPEISAVSEENLRNSEKNPSKSVWKMTKLAEKCKILQHFQKNKKKFDEDLLKFWIWNGAKVCESWRSLKFVIMLKNAYLHAKIGVDTAENEPIMLCQYELCTHKLFRGQKL